MTHNEQGSEVCVWGGGDEVRRIRRCLQSDSPPDVSMCVCVE